MKERIAFLAVISVALVNGQVFNAPKKLHPVHGLYVKPSADGTTGDLYVAATENSGTQTQWLTDQPVSFLPVGAATQQHKTTVPCPVDETSTRSISPVQYAYALPLSSATEGVVQYPYAVPAQTTTSEPGSTHPCTEVSNAYTYNPFQFFYPHMMSAYANAMSILKESGMSDDKANSIVSQASPMWSPYGAYPMYIMVDPSAWTQAATQAPPTISTTSQPNEN